MTEQLREIKKLLSRRLKKDRYEHTVGVMYTAAALAMNYGEEIQAALTAGLLHDCGKYCSAEEQIQLCRKKNIALSDAEEQMPALVHAKLGVYLAEHEYGITDQSVLDAIRWHTTGRPDMTLLEKIIYIADYIEPNRKLIPGLPEVRKLAFQSIDDAICLCSKNTVEYLRETGKPVDPMSIETYNFYDASTEQSAGIKVGGFCPRHHLIQKYTYQKIFLLPSDLSHRAVSTLPPVHETAFYLPKSPDFSGLPIYKK